MTDPAFRFLNPDMQLYRPTAFTAAEKSDESRHSNSFQQFARLKDGATIEQAQSQLDAINAANFERFPALKKFLTNARFGTAVVGFQSNLVGERRSTLSMLWGGAVVALFLAGIGIYGVLAYQVSQRRREIGIRMARGAANSSIVTLVLREGGLIVAFGLVACLLPARRAATTAPMLALSK